MAEPKTTNAKTTTTQRKVAPNIVVNAPAKRGIIDTLLDENQNKSFVYASRGSSEGQLSSQGLIPVLGKNGKALELGKRMICEDVGTVNANEIKRAHEEATERIDEIKDPTQVNSSNKTSRVKKPVT